MWEIHQVKMLGVLCLHQNLKVFHNTAFGLGLGGNVDYWDIWSGDIWTMNIWTVDIRNGDVCTIRIFGLWTIGEST